MTFSNSKFICFCLTIAARTSFSSMGPFYIFDHFDTFYSLIEKSKEPSMALLIRAVDLLFNTIDKLGQLLTAFLQKNEEAERNSYLNLVKMVLWIQINLIKAVDESPKDTNNPVVGKKGNKRSSGNEMNFDWDDKRYRSITQIYNIIQLPIENLWHTSIPEENFVK